MKATFSEEYYRNQWERFMKPVRWEHYINLEANFEKEMQAYKEVIKDNKAIEIIMNQKAKEIADKCETMLKEDMAVVKRLVNGTSSLGMTTQTQEIQERGKFVKRFEFNCLQLADFRKNHKLA